MAKTAYVDSQQRAAEFSVGDVVFLVGSAADDGVGRVVAVYPAIGMLDVEFPQGSGRFPAEDLRLAKQSKDVPPNSEKSSVPGGAGNVVLPGGPHKLALKRVATAFVKRALYWAEKNRRYRATQAELDSGKYVCPKCDDSCLQNTPYKREDGSSMRLYGCPSCLFLIKSDHILLEVV